MVLFAANTFKFSQVLQTAIDITGPNQSPVTGYSVEYAGFFALYVLVGALMTMNLFVAFIIDGFNQLRRTEGAEIQKINEIKRYKALVKRHSPHRQATMPSNRISCFIRRRILHSIPFQTFAAACVFLNILFMASFHANQSEAWSNFLELQNNIFLLLLVAEVSISIAGTGFAAFLQDTWNLIDLACIVGSVLSLGADSSSGSGSAQRSLRLLRVLQVIKTVPALRAMLETLLGSAPQFFNVIVLMMIVFSMYAVVFTTFLGSVREGFLRLGSPVAGFPADPPNFKNFGVTMYLLFRLVQGEEWNLLFYDASVQPPFCTQTFENRSFGDCGIHFGWAAVLFCSFKIIAEYVLINLFIGMIMETFLKTEEAEIDFHLKTSNQNTVSARRSSTGHGFASRRKSSVKVGTVRSDACCLSAWRSCVGFGKEKFIEIRDVPSLLKRLPQPLGFEKDSWGASIITKSDKAAIRLIVAELHLMALQRSSPILDAVKPKESFFQRTKSSWMTRITNGMGLGVPEPPDSNKVSWDEVFRTLFLWRCPSAVPAEVKALRVPLLARVVETAHAVTVARVIQRWITLHRLKKRGLGKHKTLASTIVWAQDHVDITQAVIQRNPLSSMPTDDDQKAGAQKPEQPPR